MTEDNSKAKAECIPHQFAITAQVSHGEIELEQTGDHGETQAIYIHPAFVPALIATLQKLAQEAATWPAGGGA
jgi:hypothetical protein